MLNDANLKTNIIEELSWEPAVTEADLAVEVSSGKVTLSGFVPTYAEKMAAETATRRMKGVKVVEDRIEVRLSPPSRHSDDEIASAATQRLAWDVSVPTNAVKVEVKKGFVTLTGEVGWHYQKDAAELEVLRLSGVTGVTNEIKIKPEFKASNISDHIQQALRRSFPDSTIRGSGEDGKVRLSGTVHSMYERRLAANTAWAAPGAVAVDNEISVA